MVKAKSIEALLLESPFFQSFPHDYLRPLAKCSEIVYFNQNELLLTEGEKADCFYLVLSGSVAIESHFPGREALIVSKVTTQGIVGFSWLFSPFRNQFDARAVTQGSAIKLKGSACCLSSRVTMSWVIIY